MYYFFSDAKEELLRSKLGGCARAPAASPAAYSRKMSGSASAETFCVYFDDVKAAADRIKGKAHITPVHTSLYIDELAGRSIYMKAEIFQKVRIKEKNFMFSFIFFWDLWKKKKLSITFFCFNRLTRAGGSIQVPRCL